MAILLTIKPNILEDRCFKMSEKLKYIVSELNKPPYNKKFNLISFDSLSPEDLLQVLSDVLTEIEESEKIEIKNEEPEETTIRLLTMLRVLKYDPGADPIGFRQGLVQGEKHTIHPILEWVFRSAEELRKRAYLARYLVKVDIPSTTLGDADVAALYEQYEALIEEFKAVHKEVTSLKTRSDLAAELRTDIEAMEKEKEIVQAKIHRLERKLENLDNKEQYLESARQLRLERERQRELQQQQEREVGLLRELSERYTAMSRQLAEVRQHTHGLTVQDVARKLEEEVQMTNYILSEKLPAEYAALKEEVDMMTRVAEGPQPSQERLDQLRIEIEELRSKLSAEMERNIEESSAMDERLGPFRQQAELIARKKSDVAQRYSDAKSKLDKLQQQIKEIEEQGGGRIISEKEYKDYVANLKVRKTVYTAKKAAMASLLAESGVLARTLDILKQASESLSQAEIGEQKKKELRENMSKDELLQEINVLNSKIAASKANLLPKIEEVKEKRIEFNELFEKYSELKKGYDAKTAELEGTLANLEQEVKDLLRKDTAEKSETALLRAKADVMKALLDRANSEEAFAKIRDKLTHRISEMEKESESLKEELKTTKENHEKDSKQMELWKGLQELLDCKKRCLEEKKQRGGIVRKTKMAETLVLE